MSLPGPPNPTRQYIELQPGFYAALPRAKTHRAQPHGLLRLTEVEPRPNPTRRVHLQEGRRGPRGLPCAQNSPRSPRCMLLASSLLAAPRARKLSDSTNDRPATRPARRRTCPTPIRRRPARVAGQSAATPRAQNPKNYKTMPLNWNIKNCKDHETLQSDTEWPLTHNLIWATMSIGTPEITEENWTECYARIAVWEEIVGAFSGTKDTDGNYNSRPFTPEDISKRIGLYTNASRMNRAEWQKTIGKYFAEKADAYKKTADSSLSRP